MSVDPSSFLSGLIESGVDFFTGVPDSLLKHLIAALDHHPGEFQNVVAANEGSAIALAAGAYIGSGRPAVVYLQNSGLGNTVNPIVSMASSEVYAIPMLIILGWRGEPGTKDEPQHMFQGRIQAGLLEAMGLPYEVAAELDAEMLAQTLRLLSEASTRKSPVVLVVPKNRFSAFLVPEGSEAQDFELSREEAIRIIAENGPKDAAYFSTTGMASRELYESRMELDGCIRQDFLTVGSMGHCSQIALGLALAKPSQKVVCIDGDGAALMHLGAFPTIGWRRPDRFLHILLDNQCHHSVGGQANASVVTQFDQIALNSAYTGACIVETKEALERVLAEHDFRASPYFVLVKINTKYRKDLGRPKSSPQDNREALMGFLSEE